jgi:hypothetical protein
MKVSGIANESCGDMGTIVVSSVADDGGTSLEERQSTRLV